MSNWHRLNRQQRNVTEVRTAEKGISIFDRRLHNYRVSSEYNFLIDPLLEKRQYCNRDYISAKYLTSVISNRRLIRRGSDYRRCKYPSVITLKIYRRIRQIYLSFVKRSISEQRLINLSKGILIKKYFVRGTFRIIRISPFISFLKD